MHRGTIIFIGVVAYLLLINLIAFAQYGRDKQHARQNGRRTPEKKLLGLAWLGGGLGAWLGMRRFHHKTRHWRFRIGVPAAFFVWLLPTVSVVVVFLLQWGSILFTPLMVRRSVEAKSEGREPVCDYRWVAYEQINPTLTRAVMASEDNLFATHKGFSERAIRQAWKEHREKGKVRHGGSTISQQTAKNVFTSGKRTWLRKIRETWYTVLIETFWSKQRIMEVYLNVIETGKGIYGAEAASQRYFHHSAKRLTSAESALIAVCLPNPRKYSVTNPGPYVRKRQGQILALMPKLGKIELETNN